MTDQATPALDVTVVTPTFNRARLIERALDSVRLQTRRVAEIIVVDDGSRDGTPDVARAWGERHGQQVRVVVMERNGGPAAARNRGIELARTGHVAFLDSDDEHLPDTLETLSRALDAQPSAVMSFGDATVVMPNAREPHGLFAPKVDIARAATALGGDAFLLDDARETLLAASIIPTSATCFRRDDALAVGGMPAQFRSGEDWLFFLRLTQRGRFVFTTRDVALHHRHDDNLTSPRAAEFVARQKLDGLLALGDGSLGIALTPAQQARVAAMLAAQWPAWRYHLSRMGLKRYAEGLAGHAGLSPQGALQRLLADPKALARAAAASLGLLR